MTITELTSQPTDAERFPPLKEVSPGRPSSQGL